MSKGLTAFFLFTDLTLEGFAGICVSLEAPLKLEPGEVPSLGWTKHAFRVLPWHNKFSNTSCNLQDKYFSLV